MSRFSGPQGKGAMRSHREIRRADAEARQQCEQELQATRAAAARALAAWRRSPQGRAARRWQQSFERQLRRALSVGGAQ